MQQSNFNIAMSEHFCFLLFDGFSNHCLANAVEPLRAANRLSGQDLYKWSFASENGKSIVSSSGLPVATDVTLEQCEGDILFVMPSYDYKEHNKATLHKKLRFARTRFGLLAALDTGSWMLADANILDGYQATIHWDEFEDFKDYFPHVQAQRARYIFDRDIITCSGAATVFDLAIELITRAHGATLALDVAQLFMTKLPDVSEYYDKVPHSDLVRRTVAMMKDHLENPKTIVKLSRDLGCSQRKLEILVDRELQATPQQLYQHLRLSHAFKLLRETDLTIAEISVRCGYQNQSAMGRAFKHEYGQPPGKMRHRNN